MPCRRGIPDEKSVPTGPRLLTVGLNDSRSGIPPTSQGRRPFVYGRHLSLHLYEFTTVTAISVGRTRWEEMLSTRLAWNPERNPPRCAILSGLIICLRRAVRFPSPAIFPDFRPVRANRIRAAHCNTLRALRRMTAGQSGGGGGPARAATSRHAGAGRRRRGSATAGCAMPPVRYHRRGSPQRDRGPSAPARARDAAKREGRRTADVTGPRTTSPRRFATFAPSTFALHEVQPTRCGAPGPTAACALRRVRRADGPPSMAPRASSAQHPTRAQFWG